MAIHRATHQMLSPKRLAGEVNRIVNREQAVLLERGLGRMVVSRYGGNDINATEQALSDDLARWNQSGAFDPFMLGFYGRVGWTVLRGLGQYNQPGAVLLQGHWAAKARLADHAFVHGWLAERPDTPGRQNDLTNVYRELFATAKFHLAGSSREGQRTGAWTIEPLPPDGDTTRGIHKAITDAGFVEIYRGPALNATRASDATNTPLFDSGGDVIVYACDFPPVTTMRDILERYG